MEYIHEYGIIHRDLKPDNLVITKGGHIKLIDFGLSKFGALARTTLMLQDTVSQDGRSCSGSAAQVETLQQTRIADTHAPPSVAITQAANKDALIGELRRRESGGNIPRSVSDNHTKETPDTSTNGGTPGIEEIEFVGTPGYIAPEVILGEQHGQHVDWWGMGVILFELVSGEYPFPGDTPEEIMHNAVHSEVNWELVEGACSNTRRTCTLIPSCLPSRCILCVYLHSLTVAMGTANPLLILNAGGCLCPSLMEGCAVCICFVWGDRT